MREVDPSVKSAWTPLRIALLVVAVLAPMIALGVGSPSVTASKSAGASEALSGSAKTTHGYSGGHNLAADPNGGYWTVNWLGAVTSHDGAPLFGSPPLSGIAVSKPIVGMAATPDGRGYWLVGSDGGIFSFGDAAFHGSTGAFPLNQPIVGMAPTPDGGGYWLVASDGGIFTFGDAAFHGSTGALHLNQPVIGMAATPDGGGYWLVASDGGIFTFGNGAFQGSGGFGTIGIIVSPTSAYTLVQSDGTAVAPTLMPGGTCNGTSNPTPPTSSPFSGYSLQNAMTGPQIVANASVDGYNNYAAAGPLVLPPSGWIEASHIVVTNNAIEELGYSDPAHPGVTGAGMNIGNDRVNGYGGYTFCFSLSGGDWQHVVAVFESWPADNVWQEGEIDFFAGSPSQPGLDVVQVGGCNATTNPCNVVWQSNWPASVGSGLHAVTVLWNPITGDSFYLDGRLVANAPASVGIPSTPHIPAMQVQDMNQDGSVPASSPLTASLYWEATYAFN
jgi:hypothetical protein